MYKAIYFGHVIYLRTPYRFNQRELNLGTNPKSIIEIGKQLLNKQNGQKSNTIIIVF